jgi:hypothetical protein
MNEIIKCLKEGSIANLFDKMSNLEIQEGHFELPIADGGIKLMQTMNRYGALKINLGIIEIDLSGMIQEYLDKYPKINI